MEENNTKGLYNVQEDEEQSSSFNFKTIYTIFLLNWKWFVLSLIICLGVAAIYLRYTTSIYQVTAKILIKDDSGSGSRRSSVLSSSNLGIVRNSDGIENEMEIIKSKRIAEQAVRDLKLYASYRLEGRVKDAIVYKSQPICVDIDPAHLESLDAPINLEITRTGTQYQVNGSYTIVSKTTGEVQQYTLRKDFTTLPVAINTRAGILTLTANATTPLPEGKKLKVSLIAPRYVAGGYAGSLSVSRLGEATTIAQLVLTDAMPQRASDYLKQLTVCYNRQANEDKNEIARLTEEFINGRLEKINAELGDTEGKLEDYKRRNNIISVEANAGQAMANQDAYSKKLAEANTQIELLQSLTEYMNEPGNRYQPLPANIGLSDATASSLITRYNEVVLERNRILRSASEASPSVTPLTAQLDDLTNGIRRAMAQARRTMEIERNSVSAQYGKYSGQVSSNPEQERMLTQIGRQQDVKSGLYLMLLQKREENSISLAATADKGKLIDDPQMAGKVAPKDTTILAVAVAIAIALPSLVLFLIAFFRYKIEGHDDLARLTELPIIADIAVASDTAKTKADIVVHENQNNQMEEIFRTLRTNVQFMLKEDHNVILFTSSTSGEGKTFTAANLAVSFALLDKKVILLGLDIRKPRLAELFEINDHQHGITPLLTLTDPTAEEIRSQIIPSGINNNLDLLMAGPIPPNPTELIARQSLDQIIDHLKHTYDYVLIDTAPVGLVTDTIYIGRVADLTVYVCRADYTPKSCISIVNDLARDQKLPNVGMVINGIDMSKKKYGYYYGYGKYGRYSRYGHYGQAGYGSGYGYGYGNYQSSHYGDKNDTSVKQ